LRSFDAKDRNEALDRVREELGITGRLTKKKFIAAGGQCLSFANERVFPREKA
jgi:hypothetical protein